ncbi:deoxyribonuclease-1-like 1 isoform X2 [Amia ocellicauda]|uniref:deoxyribonuclease-1-like 1 isoform X2 n=1 Tax=Amia ocellicauda TaxID=2972642 RepID=UPI003463B6CC
MKSSGLLLCLCLLEAASAFKICAFNAQHFGNSKAANAKVMSTIVRIISRCDVCLIQEVHDQKGRAVTALINALNRNNKDKYEYLASERLGRNSYQEQYVFVFRSDRLKVKDKYQYPDQQKGDIDAFSREPFVVRFEAPHTAIKDLVLIPQHTSPSNATKEIDELYDVFQEVKRLWRIDNAMFLGDFNAACGYVAKKNWKTIRLYSEPGFTWLIDHKTDTTVRQTTECAYDRIVVHGDALLRGIVPQSAKPFNFAAAFGLTEEEALEVSDHYPVEVELKVVQQRGRFGSSGSQIHCSLSLLTALSLFSFTCGPRF